MKNLLLAITMIGMIVTADVMPGDIYKVDGVIGERVGDLTETMTRIDDESQNCPNFRYVVATYKYTSTVTPAINNIYYHIYQCLSKDLVKVLGEKVYYSFELKGTKMRLPEGCPNPPVEPPKPKDPCQMGYAVGQVISRTVSNIIVPQLLNDNSENPNAGSPEFQKIMELKRTIDATSDVKEFNEEQKKIIADYQNLIKQFADEKIKCFAERVIPIKTKDVELICSEQGAYDTVEEALKSALGDQISCEHIGCDQITKNLHEGSMVQRVGLEGDDWSVVTHNEHYKEGEADFNGNIQLPKEGDNYLMITAIRGAVFPMVWADTFLDTSDRCDANNNAQRITFNNLGGFFTLRTAGGLYVALRKGDVAYIDEVVANDQRGLWRILFNEDGSVSYVNVENSNKTIGVDENTGALNIRVFNTYEKYERFYLRRDCTDKVFEDVQDVHTESFNNYSREAVIKHD